MNFLQRLFTQPKTRAEPGDITTNEEQPVGDINRLSPGLHIGRLSDIGQKRERNEDAFYTIDALTQHNGGPEPFGLFIVADGMGGHEQGEVASLVAVQAVANLVLQELYLPTLASKTNPPTPINDILVEAVQQANQAVQEQASGGGTTLTAALLIDHSAYIAHIGDTRAYLINQAEIKQITTDHSLAQHLEDSGQATAQQVAHIQNVLYRAIGQNSTVEVDTYIQHLTAGASLLICSDGLWGLVEKESLHSIVTNSPHPQHACQQLIARANERGGADNITAIIITLGIESQTGPATQTSAKQNITNESSADDK